MKNVDLGYGVTVEITPEENFEVLKFNNGITRCRYIGEKGFLLSERYTNARRELYNGVLTVLFVSDDILYCEYEQSRTHYKYRIELTEEQFKTGEVEIFDNCIAALYTEVLVGISDIFYEIILQNKTIMITEKDFNKRTLLNSSDFYEVGMKIPYGDKYIDIYKRDGDNLYLGYLGVPIYVVKVTDNIDRELQSTPFARLVNIITKCTIHGIPTYCIRDEVLLIPNIVKYGFLSINVYNLCSGTEKEICTLTTTKDSYNSTEFLLECYENYKTVKESKLEESSEFPSFIKVFEQPEVVGVTKADIKPCSLELKIPKAH